MYKWKQKTKLLHSFKNDSDVNFNNLIRTAHCFARNEPITDAIEDIWLFHSKIDFYFTEWTPKVVFSRVAEPRVKILLLVFMSEIKIDLTLKKSNFLFLLCLKNAIIKFIPMRQLSRQRNGFFSSRFTSNLMLPACLLGMILVVNTVCNSEIAWNFSTLNRS